MIKSEQYCISRENILMHELMGLKALVVKSTDKNREGMKGKVIDETKNTLVLEGGKVIPKKEVELEFDLGNEKVLVEGKKLIGRSEDRVKSKAKLMEKNRK